MDTFLCTIDANYGSSFLKHWKVNFSSLVTPTKKEVDVKTSRKPTKTVMIMEKPVDMSSQSVSMPSGGGGGNELLSSAVQDEKMLMKMQSTSSLKYT